MRNEAIVEASAVKIIAAALIVLAAGCTPTPGVIAPEDISAGVPAALTTTPVVNVASASGWASVEDCMATVKRHVPKDKLHQFAYARANPHDREASDVSPYVDMVVREACEHDVSLQQLPDNVRRVYERMQYETDITLIWQALSHR